MEIQNGWSCSYLIYYFKNELLVKSKGKSRNPNVLNLLFLATIFTWEYLELQWLPCKGAAAIYGYTKWKAAPVNDNSAGCIVAGSWQRIAAGKWLRGNEDAIFTAIEHCSDGHSAQVAESDIWRIDGRDRTGVGRLATIAIIAAEVGSFQPMGAVGRINDCYFIAFITIYQCDGW